MVKIAEIKVSNKHDQNYILNLFKGSWPVGCLRNNGIEKGDKYEWQLKKDAI